MLINTSKIDLHIKQKLSLNFSENSFEKDLKVYFEIYLKLIDEIILFVGENFSKKEIQKIEDVLTKIEKDNAYPNATLAVMLNIVHILMTDVKKIAALNSRLYQYVDNLALERLGFV